MSRIKYTYLLEDMCRRGQYEKEIAMLEVGILDLNFSDFSPIPK